MVRASKHSVRVRAGGRVEFSDPALPEGAEAEVIVLLREPQSAPPLTSFFGQGRGCFAEPADVDAWLRAERDSWDG